MQICDAIHSRARQSPEKPALIEGDLVTSYAALSDQVRKTAAALQSLGIRPGDPVGMFVRESTQHVVTKLAIIQVGAAAFTLDRRSKPDVERLLAHMPAQTKVLSEPGHTMPDRVDVVPLDDDWDHQVARQPIKTFPDVNGDNPALIVLTSGSTGGAKAVVSTQREHLWRYLQKNLYLPAAASDTRTSFRLHIPLPKGCRFPSRTAPRNRLLSSAKLLQTGFEPKFKTLEAALSNIYENEDS